MPYAHRQDGGFTYLGAPTPPSMYAPLYANICGEYPGEMFVLLPFVAGTYRLQNVVTGLEISVESLDGCWVAMPSSSVTQNPPVTPPVGFTITSVSPTTVPHASGVLMTVIGTNLNLADFDGPGTANITLYTSGTQQANAYFPDSYTIVSNTEITFPSPIYDTTFDLGSHDIDLSSESFEYATTFTNAFTVIV